MLNQLIIATEIAFATALIAPVVHTAIWVLSPIWTQSVPATPVPELGAARAGEEIIAAIERHIPAAAASITVPVAVTHIERPQPVALAAALAINAVSYADMKVPALRKECAAKGITWRNAHGKNRHLKQAEMVAALEAL